MKNIDKVRAMSVEELARKIAGLGCEMCFYQRNGHECRNNRCESGIAKWLNQETNLMPELKAGDIVDTNTGLSFVAISPMTLVSRGQRKQYNLEDITKKLPTGITRRIIRILRYGGDCYQTIWRADDV